VVLKADVVAGLDVLAPYGRVAVAHLVSSSQCGN
jgi:hypothetical protein